MTGAQGTVRSGGRALATLLSGWYRCEGVTGAPTWKARGRDLVSSSRGAAVLALAVAALGLLVVLPAVLLGGEASKPARARAARAAARRRGTWPLPSTRDSSGPARRCRPSARALRARHGRRCRPAPAWSAPSSCSIRAPASRP